MNKPIKIESQNLGLYHAMFKYSSYGYAIIEIDSLNIKYWNRSFYFDTKIPTLNFLSISANEGKSDEELEQSIRNNFEVLKKKNDHIFDWKRQNVDGSITSMQVKIANLIVDDQKWVGVELFDKTDFQKSNLAYPRA